MKRDDVLRMLAAHRDDFVAMGVREIAIFGSVARDEAGAGSDVDVLVDYEPGTRLSCFRVFELRERLEELLDAKVDLVTMGGLRHELREGILAEAIRAAWQASGVDRGVAARAPAAGCTSPTSGSP
ncbi:MAG: nucleotidyltransferase domain-containing protein [Actinomycetes bacterium]